MSRRQRRTAIGGQFAPRLIEMLEAPAYRVLSLSALRILDRIEIEHAHHGGTDNGKLPVTYDDFEKYGIHRHAIGPAIREAVALGFIVITREGRAGNAEWRIPNLYRLTYRFAEDVQTKTGCSHEWRKIETIEEAKRIAKTARLAKPEKNKSPVVENAKSRYGIRTENGQIHSTESTTTVHSTESTTTIDISGRGRRSLPTKGAITPPDNNSPSSSHDDGARPPGERPVVSEHDFLSEDGTVFVSRAELDELARTHPTARNIAGLLQEACTSWLCGPHIAPGERKQEFLAWLAARSRKGGFN